MKSEDQLRAWEDTLLELHKAQQVIHGALMQVVCQADTIRRRMSDMRFGPKELPPDPRVQRPVKP